MAEVDVCVILDLAPVPDRNKDSFINRNLAVNQKTNVRHWLTVPIQRNRGQAIRDVVTAPTEMTWKKKHIHTLRHFYPDHDVIAPGFINEVQKIIEGCSNRLVDINFQLVLYFLMLLLPKIKPPIFQSNLGIEHSDSHRSDIARLLGATQYRAGVVEAKILADYQYRSMFESSDVEVTISRDIADAGICDELFVRTSCIHPVLTIGIDGAQELIAGAVKHLRG